MVTIVVKGNERGCLLSINSEASSNDSLCIILTTPPQQALNEYLIGNI
jgi:hypothetical protein